MTEERVEVLIVGGGEAGLALAERLRELGEEGRILVVGQEAHPPYQRPPLSKAFLRGTADETSLELRDPAFLAERRIELRPGRRAVRAMRDPGSTPGQRAEHGGTVELDDGSRIRWSRLALATGARPRTLPGAEGLRGVLTLRGIDDAAALRAVLVDGVRLVVIGGGFIGLEVAQTALAHGAEVTVLEAAPRLLARLCSPALSAHVEAHHRDSGVHLVLGAQVVGLHAEDGAVTGVELAGGEVLPADAVVVGIGAVPEVALAADLGLDVDRGIVADAAGRTGVPGIVAVGDCTAQPHPHRAGVRIGLESVDNAVEQGKAAAHVLRGAEPPSRRTPWFWSDQGSLKIQIAGIADGFDEAVVRAAEGRLTVLLLRQGRLIAGETANDPRDFLTLRRLLDGGAAMDRARAADPDVPLKDAVIPADGRPGP